MPRICIIDVVGLTPRLLEHAPHLKQLAQSARYGLSAWQSPLPAVTCTCQATLLTGVGPRDHGIVGNGWLFRETQEVRFWQQAYSLVEQRPFYDRFETAKMFWWFNQSSSARYRVTPKPHYGCDGSKVFDVDDRTGCRLTERLGPFPFFSFWGPQAGLPSSRWIAEATALVMREKRPEITLAYLPHLDYDFQRQAEQDSQRVAEVDACAAVILEAADAIGAEPIIVSEYGLVPVQHPVSINRVLRQSGLLAIRSGPFGEMLIPGESKAFAVADHQLAHVYVRDAGMIEQVRTLLQQVPGIDRVVDPVEVGLDHPRSGELIALADRDAWFTYYYWEEDAKAPDFARTVDIHRKPGYDPCELFMTSKFRAMRRLFRKKLGFRYSMDVIPLDATCVKGSHGLHPADPLDGPLIVGPGRLPDAMVGFADYVRTLMSG